MYVCVYNLPGKETAISLKKVSCCVVRNFVASPGCLSTNNFTVVFQKYCNNKLIFDTTGDPLANSNQNKSISWPAFPLYIYCNFTLGNSNPQ